MELGKIVKTFTSKKGNDVVFRYPKQQDFAAAWQYANVLIAEDTFVDLSGKPLTEEEERKWFDELVESVQKGKKIALVVEVNSQYAGIGEVRIGQRRRSHVGNIGLSLAPTYRDEGIGTELLKALIDEARALGLRLLTLYCFENNTRALHVYEKLGFKKSGVTPGAIAFKGDYVGEVKLYLPLVP